MEFEKWQQIIGFNDRYLISNLGNIKSLYTFRYNKGTMKVEKILRIKKLKPVIDRQGYLVVKLYKNNFGKTFKIHRLVAKAFVDNPNNYNVVNHKNEIKTDNRASNLEWCNQKYNVRYSANKLPQKRKIIREDGKEYNSITEALKELGLKTNHISDVCNGKRVKTGGYSFKYKEELYGVQ